MHVSRILLTFALLCLANVPYVKAQFINRSSSDVNKVRKAPGVDASKTPPEFYELRCRGGTVYVHGRYMPLPQQLEFNVTEAERDQATNERMMNMSVRFAPASAGVDAYGSNLEPGQCSWVDRGMRPNEPTFIRQQIVYFGQEAQARHGTTVDYSATAAERHPDSMNVPKYLKDENHYWSFFVRNSGNGFFEATNSRYWKPPIPDGRKARTYSKVSPN